MNVDYLNPDIGERSAMPFKVVSMKTLARFKESVKSNPSGLAACSPILMLKTFTKVSAFSPPDPIANSMGLLTRPSSQSSTSACLAHSSPSATAKTGTTRGLKRYLSANRQPCRRNSVIPSLTMVSKKHCCPCILRSAASFALIFLQRLGYRKVDF